MACGQCAFRDICPHTARRPGSRNLITFGRHGPRSGVPGRVGRVTARRARRAWRRRTSSSAATVTPLQGPAPGPEPRRRARRERSTWNGRTARPCSTSATRPRAGRRRSRTRRRSWTSSGSSRACASPSSAIEDPEFLDELAARVDDLTRGRAETGSDLVLVAMSDAPDLPRLGSCARRSRRTARSGWCGRRAARSFARTTCAPTARRPARGREGRALLGHAQRPQDVIPRAQR